LKLHEQAAESASTFRVATLLPNAEVSRSALRGYRVFIFSHDHPHPPHVHFGKGRRFSSWDVVTAACIDEDGFSSADIRQQRKMLVEHRDAIVRSWHEHWQRQEVRGGEG
jgi:hypothetical protein